MIGVLVTITEFVLGGVILIGASGFAVFVLCCFISPGEPFETIREFVGFALAVVFLIVAVCVAGYGCWWVGDRVVDQLTALSAAQNHAQNINQKGIINHELG